MKLYCLLKKKLEDDFWTIVNRERVKETNFERVVLNEFLSFRTVNLKNVILFAKELRMVWEEIIIEIYDLIEVEFGNVSTIVKEIKKYFSEKITPITKNIDSYKKFLRDKDEKERTINNNSV